MSGPKRRALVIGRRRPGRPIKEIVREASLAAAAAGWSVDERVVKRKSELRRETRRALRRKVRLVVVVGGDGAVGQVVTVLAGTPCVLGVVPTGTGNLLAGNLGLPTERGEAITTIFGGRERRIDVGIARIDGERRAFTIACGIGYDADVMNETPRERKTRWGQLAYLSSALGQAASIKAVKHQLVIDGRQVEVEAAQVFVANAGRMFPLVEPRMPVLPDDGRLDVIAIMASGPVPAALAGWEALRQDEQGVSSGGHVFRARAQRIRVKAHPSRRVELDGSAVGETPVDIRVLQAGLRVMVPAS